MGRIVFWISISLDGFFERPDRKLDWHRVDEELHAYMNQQLGPAAAFLEGRITWEMMAAYWPAAETDPRSSPPEVEFSRMWVDKPKYVFSRTLQEAGWNTTIVRDVSPADIRALAARSPGDLIVGGPNLVAEFLRHDLIDDLHIYVHPVVIGRGHPAFPPDARLNLRLTETRRFGNGVVLLHYEVARA